MEKHLQFINNLSDDYKKSLVWYTGGDFDVFNEKLRKDKQLSQKEKHHLQNISKIFEMSAPIKLPIIVYKGKGSTNVYNDKAFVSTTIEYKLAKRFSGKNCCILQITVSPGSKILPLWNVSRENDEGEILLNRNGEFKITGETINDEDNMKIIFVTYYEQGSQNLKQIDKAIPKLDKDLIVERIIEFFSDEEDKDFIDDESINDMYKKITKKEIDSNTLEKIKTRLDI